MRELNVVVEGLRLVQRARNRFMEFWAIEKEYTNPILDRIAEDLQRVVPPEGSGDTNLTPPAASEEER